VTILHIHHHTFLFKPADTAYIHFVPVQIRRVGETPWDTACAHGTTLFLLVASDFLHYYQYLHFYRVQPTALGTGSVSLYWPIGLITSTPQ